MPEHVWKGERCAACWMDRSWPGAKDSCARGGPKKSDDQRKQYLARKYQARKAANA